MDSKTFVVSWICLPVAFVVVPRFNSYIMKHSLSHRGAILWNTVSRYNTSDFNTFYSNVKKDVLVKELNFACTSAQSQPRNRTEFKFNYNKILFYCNKHVYSTL